MALRRAVGVRRWCSPAKTSTSWFGWQRRLGREPSTGIGPSALGRSSGVAPRPAITPSTRSSHRRSSWRRASSTVLPCSSRAPWARSPEQRRSSRGAGWRRGCSRPSSGPRRRLIEQQSGKALRSRCVGPEDFVPRGALELILQAHDVCSGVDVPFDPPEDVCEHLRRHTRSWPVSNRPGWAQPAMTGWQDWRRAPCPTAIGSLLLL